MSLQLINRANVTDAGLLELNGAVGVTTAVVGGTTYLFVAGFLDDGLSVFSVAADGTLTNVDNVTDDGTLALLRARAVTTAVVDGTTYLFVAAAADDGVSVFSVAANGTLTNVDNVTDTATLQLDGARSVTTAIVGVTTCLFVSGSNDSGVSLFQVTSGGTLINVDSVADAGALRLGGVRELITAKIGGGRPDRSATGGDAVHLRRHRRRHHAPRSGQCQHRPPDRTQRRRPHRAGVALAHW